MTYGGDDHSGVPGADDRRLHIGIPGYVDHRAEPTGKEDRVVIEDVDFGQLAAPGQPAVCLAVQESGLLLVLGIEPVFWRLTAQRRCELHSDACSVEHSDGVRDFGEEESRRPVVRPDHRGVCCDDKDVGDSHGKYSPPSIRSWHCDAYVTSFHKNCHRPRDRNHHDQRRLHPRAVDLPHRMAAVDRTLRCTGPSRHRPGVARRTRHRRRDPPPRLGPGGIRHR